MCLDHRNVYMVECHLESNQSTFMVENTHQVTQCELLYFHSAFKDKECPMNWAIFPAVLMLYFSKRQKLFPLWFYLCDSYFPFFKFLIFFF